MKTNATTTKELPAKERKAVLERLVKEGKVSPKSAAMVNFREPSVKAQEHAAKLAARAGQFLGGKRVAA